MHVVMLIHLLVSVSAMHTPDHQSRSLQVLHGWKRKQRAYLHSVLVALCYLLLFADVLYRCMQATVRPPVVRNFNYIVLPFTYIVGCFPWIVLAFVGG